MNDILDKDSAQQVLRKALSRGGDFADIYYQNKTFDYISYQDGKVHQAYTRIQRGVGIRVLKEDQTGFASTEDLSLEGLLAVASTAAAIATSAPASIADRFHSVKIPKLYPETPLWNRYPAEKNIAMVQSLGERIDQADPAIIKSNIHFNCSDEHIILINSEGLWIEEHRPMTLLYAFATAEKEGRRENNNYSISARKGPEFYNEKILDRMVQEVVSRTLRLFDAHVPPAGEMPIVLAPGSSGIFLHEAMGHGFEADFNRKNISVFSDKMNRQVAPDFVNIIDSGLEAETNGALQMDDEGTPTQKTLLVEKGKLVSYLHDRISARHYGVLPTGNGRRQDYSCLPIPRMRTTYMENGPHDPEEIIRSVKKGIYAEDFSNGQVDIGGGDFSFFIKTGYLIEDGKLTAPIKDANIIGNGPECLSKITMAGTDMKLYKGAGMCGKEGQGVPVGFGQPTVKISSINIGGVN